MKNIFFLLLFSTLLSCKKAFVEPTHSSAIAMPWTDTSNRHPKKAVFQELVEKYRQKGLPGISLLVRDKNGTWMGATGKADVEQNISFTTGTVSKAASITKLFIGTLVFKLIEDSTHSGLTYQSLQQSINKWLPHKITDKLPNGNSITLGQCMKHETGVPDVIEQNAFYLAVLNQPNKMGP
ncbi:MAG: serine hydrolase [Flavisolibacter sp.]|nr:serine hydrolase [Flavisolibacter sp.]